MQDVIITLILLSLLMETLCLNYSLRYHNARDSNTKIYQAKLLSAVSLCCRFSYIMTNTMAQHNLMYYIVELMDFHNFKQMFCPFLSECIRLELSVLSATTIMFCVDVFSLLVFVYKYIYIYMYL